MKRESTYETRPYRKEKKVKNTTIMLLISFLLFSFFLLGVPINTFAAQGTNAVSLGVSGLFGSETRGYLEYIEYEKKFTRVFAVYAAAEHIAYQYDTGPYVETGRGPGAEFGVRAYPFKRTTLMDWYVGAGWGSWSIKGNWKDDVGTPFVTRGAFRSSIAGFSLQTGYKWYFGSHALFVDPRLQFGMLRGSGASEAFGYAEMIVAGRVAIGMSW